MGIAHMYAAERGYNFKWPRCLGRTLPVSPPRFSFYLSSLFSALLLRVLRSTFLISQILGSIESDKKR